MIQLSQRAINEFKKLYSQKHGVLLSNEEANRRGIELLEYIKLMYKPIPSNFIGLSYFLRCDGLVSFSKNEKQLDIDYWLLYPPGTKYIWT